MEESQEPEISLQTHEKIVRVKQLSLKMIEKVVPALEEAVREFDTGVDTHTHISALVSAFNHLLCVYLLSLGLDAITYVSVAEGAIKNAEDIVNLEKQFGEHE